MRYLLRLLAILTTSAVMTSCGANQYHTNVAGYPNRYSAFDYKYAWKTAITDQGVVIDGVMKNVRYPFIDSVYLMVNVQGKNEQVVARASTFPMPQQTREGDVSRFTLTLRNVKPVSGDLFQFQVHYKGSGGGNNDGIDWISSFKVDALTGAVIRPERSNPDEW